MNGTSYTEVNDLNTSRYGIRGSGTQTSALGFGGYTTTQQAVTELWNGTNWTEVNDLNQARYQLCRRRIKQHNRTGVNV